MTSTHCSLLSEHLGMQKTLDKVRSDFNWSSMNQDVHRFVMSCDTCQRKVINKKYYNKKSRSRELEVNDKVLVLLPVVLANC